MSLDQAPGEVLKWESLKKRRKDNRLMLLCPPTKGGGGHIVFGADPVGVSVGVSVGVRVASFPHVIF